MAELKIRIGAEDIERIILGGSPSEEARLEFRRAVLAKYAETHVKPLENSQEIKKFKDAMSAELNVALEKYVVDTTKRLSQFNLKQSLRDEIAKEAGSVFRIHLVETIRSQKEKLDKIAIEMQEKVKDLEERVEIYIANLGANKDAEMFVYDAFTKVMNEHLQKFVRGRSLAELEELAAKKLADSRKQEAV